MPSASTPDARRNFDHDRPNPARDARQRGDLARVVMPISTTRPRAPLQFQQDAMAVQTHCSDCPCDFSTLPFPRKPRAPNTAPPRPSSSSCLAEPVWPRRARPPMPPHRSRQPLPSLQERRRAPHRDAPGRRLRSTLRAQSHPVLTTAPLRPLGQRSLHEVVPSEALARTCPKKQLARRDGTRGIVFTVTARGEQTSVQLHCLAGTTCTTRWRQIAVGLESGISLAKCAAALNDLRAGEKRGEIFEWHGAKSDQR